MKKDSLKVYTTITLMLVASLSLQKVDFSNNNIGKIQTISTPAARPTPMPIVREKVVPEIVKSDAPTPVPTPLMTERHEVSKPSVEKNENFPTPVPAPSCPAILAEDSANIKRFKI